MVGSEVRGIITQADLNKPPVRVYLFGVLSLFEMHVTFWLRAEYPRDAWETMLKGRAIDEARRLRDDKQRRGHDTSLLDCVTLGTKRQIMARSEDLMRRLGITRADLHSFQSVQTLRNRLAHSYDDLAAEQSWEDIASTVRYVEDFVTRSDEAIEAEAAARSHGFEDNLWAAA